MNASRRTGMLGLLLVVLYSAAEAQTLTRYWADLQGDNTGFGTAMQYFTFARDSVALDVVAMTPQGTKLTDTQWNNLRAAAAATYAPGSFVPFSGYEWNSDTWGHKAVYYLTDDQPFYKPNVAASDHPSEFYALTLATNGIAHAAHPTLQNVTTNWNWHDPRVVLNAEIYSRWGQYETHPTNGKAVRDVWGRGFRLGALGTSDTHTHPGIEGGLTAIYATALTRESIADAMRAHRTYATSGARIGLEFNIGSATFGDIVNDVVGNAVVQTRIQATSPISRVEIRRNNTLVHSYAPPPQRIFVEVGAPLAYFKGNQAPPAGWNAYVFNESGWLSGRSGIGFGDSDDVTTITGMVNNYYSLFTRQVFTVTDVAPQYLFMGVDYDDGFVAYIDGVEVLRANMPAGAIAFNSPAGPVREPNLGAKAVPNATVPPFYTDNGLAGGTPKSPTLDLFDISAFSYLLSPGPHVLAIQVHNSLLSSNDLTLIPRLFELNPSTSANVNFTDAGATGDRFYDVKVIQIDGEMAWSSPIWLNPDAPPRPVATLSDVPADNGTALNLTWTKSVAADFRYYNVFVSDTNFTDAAGMSPWNANPITNADSLAATITHIDGQPLQRGKTYYVYVGAFDWADKFNSATIGSIASAAPADNLPPAAPGSISVTDTPNDDGGSLRVSWTLSPDDGAGARDVVRYEIFRRKSTTSSYSSTPLVTRVAGTTSYQDNTPEDATNYHYKIRATDGVNVSPYTVEFGPVMAVNNGGLPEPKNVAAADRTGDQGGWIRLTWSLIPQDASITRYEVFRTTNSGVYGSRYGEVPRGTSTFFDSLAAANTDYYYVVVADSAGARKSASSAEAGPTRALDNLPPASITTLVATNTATGGTVNLNWTGYDQAGQRDVGSYDIYSKTSSFTSVSSLVPIASVPAGTFSTDVTGLVNNSNYYFAVVPVDVSGNYANGVTSKLGKPTDTTAPVFAGLAAATPGDGSVNLSWISAQDNTLPLTYQLHQSLTPTGFNYTTPTATIPGSRPILPLGSSWRYLKGTSAPPAGWNQRGFDDIGWLAGEGAFGYDTSNRYQPVTVFNDMNGVYSSVFFRSNFTLSAIPASLILGILVDDGYVAYLNGVEVSRYNLDDPLTHSSLAESGTSAPWSSTIDHSRPSNYNPDPAMTQIDISAFTNLLVVGTNTIAVRVHNYKKSNTDFLFLAELSEATRQHKVTGLSASQTYYWVMRVVDAAGNKNLNTVVKSGKPLLTPPPMPVPGFTATKAGANVVLRWLPVISDSVGNSLAPHHYNVYRGTTPDFLPDTAGHANLVASPTATTYTDPNAVDAAGNYYYRVTAASESGRESYGLSALGIKATHSFAYTPGQTNVFLISVPYLTGMPDAQTLLNDLNRGPFPGPVQRIQRLNAATQSLQSLAFDQGAWVGDNFPLAAGEAYAITLTSNLSTPLVGAHSATIGLNFPFRTETGNQYWLALPIHAAYTDAMSLLSHLNGGPTPTAVSKIVRLDPATGAPVSTLHFAGQWLGENFTIQPGQGYGILLRGNVSGWRPQVKR